jgi:hypothetical protein
MVMSDPAPAMASAIAWPEPHDAAQSDGFRPRATDKPRPQPVPAPVAPEETPREEGGRPPLPQRRPQENLISQLRDDPDNDVESDDAREFGQSRTLSAFHKGTQRGRESDVTAD